MYPVKILPILNVDIGQGDDESGEVESPFYGVPNEILIQIFSHSEDFTTIESVFKGSIEFVCKRWLWVKMRMTMGQRQQFILDALFTKITSGSLQQRFHYTFALGKTPPIVKKLHRPPESGGELVYMDPEGVYLKTYNKTARAFDFSFYKTDGSREPSFRGEITFSKRALFVQKEGGTIEVLSPHSGTSLHELPAPQGASDVHTLVPISGGDQLVAIYTECQICLWDTVEKSTIVSTAFEKETIFEALKFSGTHAVLLHSSKSLAQFSFWQEDDGKPMQLHFWSTQLNSKVIKFYYNHPSVVAADDRQLCHYNLDTQEEGSAKLIKSSEEEWIMGLYCAGKNRSIVTTMQRQNTGAWCDKIYEWNYSKKGYRVVHTLERGGSLKHIHVFGTRLIIASAQEGLFVLDSITSEIYKPEGVTIDGEITQCISRGDGQLALVYKKEGGGEKLLFVDFTNIPDAEETTG
jgi:hypothetical protein